MKSKKEIAQEKFETEIITDWLQSGFIDFSLTGKIVFEGEPDMYIHRSRFTISKSFIKAFKEAIDLADGTCGIEDDIKNLEKILKDLKKCRVMAQNALDDLKDDLSGFVDS